MIREIVKQINSQLDYTFKDVLVGIVHPHDLKGQMVPMASDGTTYPEAIPHSAKTSIVYWEDMGSRTAIQAVRYRYVEHDVRLVVWLNFDRIEQSYEDCIREIMGAVPQKIDRILIAKKGQEAKSNNIFARYGYEERKQYITWPYDVFAINISIKYPDTGC